MLFYFKKFDWPLIGSVLVLSFIGLMELRGVDAGEGTAYFFRQLFFLGCGVVAMFSFSFFDIQIFKNSSFFLVAIYFLLIAILGTVLVLGHKVHGMTGWFRFGQIGFAPVEFAKVILILILAKYFSGRHIEVYRIRHIIISGIYTLFPAVFVLMQPDLGSVLILVFIWLGIVILSGMKSRHLSVVLLLGILVSVSAWFFVLKTYQKERILSVLDSNRDPLGYNYNINQAKIAIGSGGLFGKGLGRSSQGQLSFLPEKHTDFIFALFAEEWGFAGILFFFAVYSFFFYRLIKIIIASFNNFFRLFTAGFAVMIFAHLLINVGMNLGIIPVTGIPLPFLSYGGSNLLVNFIALGIIQNINIQSKKSGAVFSNAIYF